MAAILVSFSHPCVYPASGFHDLVLVPALNANTKKQYQKTINIQTLYQILNNINAYVIHNKKPKPIIRPSTYFLNFFIS